MTTFTHTLECNLLMIPPKVDRFFMDMRVYEILAHRLPSTQEDEDTLIWRGIFLAVEQGPKELDPN